MDSIYTLFFVICIISLCKVIKSGSKIYLYIYMVSLGLALLTKGMHAGMIICITMLMLPRVLKKIKLKDVVCSTFIAIAEVAIWAIPRYCFDGFEFFKKGIVGEASDKVQKFSLENYRIVIKFLLSQSTWKIFILLFICFTVFYIFDNNKKQIKEYALEVMPIIMGMVCPIVLYSLVGATLEWYYYPAFICADIINALVIAYIISRIRKVPIKYFVVLIYGAACMFVGIMELKSINSSCDGFSRIMCYRDELMSIDDRYGEQYRDKNVYIVNPYNVYSDETNWECDYVYLSESLMNWTCINGAVSDFRADKDSLLVLSKDILNEYQETIDTCNVINVGEYIILEN